MGSDAISTKRSSRQSGTATPNEAAGPTFTASGRQIRVPVGGFYGQSMLSGQNEQISTATNGDETQDGNENVQIRTRTRGGARQASTNNRGRKHIEGYNELDEMEDESDATSSGGEWDGGDDDDVDGNIVDDEEDDVEMSDSGRSAEELEHDPAVVKSLIVTLRYHKKQESRSAGGPAEIQDTIIVNSHPILPKQVTIGDGEKINPPYLEGITVTHTDSPRLKNNHTSTKTKPRLDVPHQHATNSHPKHQEGVEKKEVFPETKNMDTLHMHIKPLSNHPPSSSVTLNTAHPHAAV